jgi:nicotinate-nucleotide--dimethylbenzimidazole phosphoribosyltransferase
MLSGLLLGAAVRRTPVLLDGVSAVAAAVVARDAAARITRWFRLADAGTDLAGRHAVTRLGLVPLLDLELSGVGVTAGVGGVLGVGHVRAAARLADAPLSLGRPSADV